MTAPMDGREILVVDDNEKNLIALEAALEQLGRKLVFARSGTEALRRLLEQNFALIIMDVNMPELDGLETAKLIRARDRNRSTPIIFVTGVAFEDASILRAYDLGAFDYLVKPIRPEILRAKARVFVELHERTVQLQEALRHAHDQELEAQRRTIEAEAMGQQMKQLLEMDRKKDEFIAILAHELRNPLQPLLTAVETIDETPHEPVGDRTRDILRRHLQHVRRLVDDLLDVARFTARKLELHRERVLIDDAIEQAVVQSHRTVDERNHELVVNEAGPDAVVDGDPVRLVQVISNLINNAAKYTPDGGRIEIAASRDRDDVVVSVTDNGRGISPDLLSRIFEMFVQERSTGDGVGGLGLGLGLVKRLVEMHGGTVHGSSDGEGKGSQFVLRLPVFSEAARIHGARPVADVLSLRVVVCEPAREVRDVLAEILRSRGHEVLTVSNGLEGLRVIRAERPDVALLDITSSGLSFRAVQTLQSELGPQMPRLVAMSGFGQTDDGCAALEAGFDAHLTKPATAEAILQALHREES